MNSRDFLGSVAAVALAPVLPKVGVWDEWVPLRLYGADALIWGDDVVLTPELAGLWSGNFICDEQSRSLLIPDA